jgi:dipeptidyl aminopeptidase/acylaminoacyl peptidase
MVKAMRAKGRRATLIVYTEEGHGFERLDTNLDFCGRMEEFLAKYLGGRKEPWEKVAGCSVAER